MISRECHTVIARDCHTVISRECHTVIAKVSSSGELTGAVRLISNRLIEICGRNSMQRLGYLSDFSPVFWNNMVVSPPPSP